MHALYLLPALHFSYAGMTPAHFKGMLFASGNRWQGDFTGAAAGVGDPFDPRSLWKLWHTFGISESTMYGWWMERERGNGTVPVTCSSSVVKVTSYVRKGNATLLALASFASADTKVTLTIDWVALGLPPNTRLVAPQLPPFQNAAASFDPTAAVTVPALQGWLFVLGM
jgi:hypothetical protein